LSIASLLILALGISYAAPVAQNLGKAQSAFPATVCPAKLGDGTTSVFLPKYKSSIRHVVKKSITFYKSASANENILSNPLLVDSNPGTSFALNNSANGIGMVTCRSGNPDEWFVGGSGGVTSKAQLDIVNSGLSPAIVDITGYSSKQVLPVVSVSIPANSDRIVSVDALVPGDDSVALHVVTRAGRVTSFLFDQRKKGLSSLGSDFVNSQPGPATYLVIPTLMQSSNGKVASAIRILVPGNLDANVKLNVNSGDGSFTPLGFDGRTIVHGKVIDIPLKDLTSTTPMSIVIESDQPLVASSLTALTHGDFAWATPVAPVRDIALNFTGLSPHFVFTGSEINISVNWKNSIGKSMTSHITGSEIAFWNPGQGGARTVSFHVDSKKGIYGGVIIRNSSGSQLAYLPLSVGAILERSTLPIVDVRSLLR
jgi:hypothetical protein